MIRLILDEHINPAVARALRQTGIDAITAEEAGGKGLSDELLLEVAVSAGRAVVTYNVADWALLSARWIGRSRRHFGIILVPARSIPQTAVGGLVRALTAFLKSEDARAGIEDQTIFLRKRGA